jgi:hypothetical protein
VGDGNECEDVEESGDALAARTHEIYEIRATMSPNVNNASLQAYQANGNPTVAHQPGEQRLMTFAAVNPTSHA